MSLLLRHDCFHFDSIFFDRRHASPASTFTTQVCFSHSLTHSPTAFLFNEIRNLVVSYLYALTISSSSFSFAHSSNIFVHGKYCSPLRKREMQFSSFSLSSFLPSILLPLSFFFFFLSFFLIFLFYSDT